MHTTGLSSSGVLYILKRHLRLQYGQSVRSSGCPRFYSLQPESRQSETQDAREGKNVAIIGGGITGLAAAHFLTKSSPETRITLFEGGKRLGGWLHSEVVETSNGKVIFEKGPRTLRPNLPNGLLTLDLIRDLGLEDRILATSKNSVAAQNRYVYYPDHLVRMPGPGTNLFQALSSLLTEPAFAGLFSALVRDAFASRESLVSKDESIASFFSRRLDSRLADNLVSAVLHGIYAGDIEKLSMQSLLPSLWKYAKWYGSLRKGFSKEGQHMFLSVHDTRLLREVDKTHWPSSKRSKSEKLTTAEASSVFTLKGGLGELASWLEASLMRNSMVRLEKETLVDDLRLDGGQVRLCTQSSEKHAQSKKTNYFSHVISTISAKTLNKIAKAADGRQVLLPFDEIPSVSVMVVNTFYSNPSILPVHGFGYLIPRSIPFAQNAERALGVVFDSDASIGQDDIPGTKVTVMLGGHWWDGWESFPDEHEGAKMAKAVLKRHLRITAEPDAISVSVQKDCIPQYTVGHRARLEKGNDLLKRFRGQLRVAGNSYTGVGLNDCVRSAYQVANSLHRMDDPTGLQWFFEEPFLPIKIADIPRKPWLIRK